MFLIDVLLGRESGPRGAAASLGYNRGAERRQPDLKECDRGARASYPQDMRAQHMRLRERAQNAAAIPVPSQSLLYGVYCQYTRK